MRDISTEANTLDVVSVKEGLQHQTDATAPQSQPGVVSYEHSNTTFSYFAKYGYRDVSLKER